MTVVEPAAPEVVTPEMQRKIDIAETIGTLRFVVENLDDSIREATNAADAIECRNLVAAYRHLARFAAYARSACKTFKDMIDMPNAGGANG